MKFLDEYKILENISQAKAILRKVNKNVDDINYNKIIDKTNKDGYTGLLTKLFFIDKVDLEEVLNLYDDLKHKKIDVGQISKKTYDEILDFVYDDIIEENNIEYLFDHNNYRVFWIKTYEAGLTINSPSWCLKTKNYWEQYIAKGSNIVAILNDYVNKSGKTSLPTPETFFGEMYRNTKKPEVRLGITVKRTHSFDYFDDDNNSLGIYYKLCDDIAKKAYDIVVQQRFMNNDEKLEFILDEFGKLVENFGSKSFDYHYYKFHEESKEKEDKLLKFLSSEILGENVAKFLRKSENRLFVLQELQDSNGLNDIFLYLLYGDEIPLSGTFLDERGSGYDLLMRFTYGIHKYKWGVNYILQSYESIDEYFKNVCENFHILIIGDNEAGGSPLYNIIYMGELEKDGFRKYYKYEFKNNEHVIHFNINKFLLENVNDTIIYPDKNYDIDYMTNRIISDLKDLFIIENENENIITLKIKNNELYKNI
jgi:hypothetical protein